MIEMPADTTGSQAPYDQKSDAMFESAAELFRVMSAPLRLKIINCLCEGEKNVSELLARIDTTQPNMSQHLNTLYQAGILAKRREGVQIFYRINDQRIVSLCEAMCHEVARKGSDPQSGR
ncbi:MAG: metalloregulator ArsR/SmtB family transcription factor [Rhodoferax sp.]